MGVFIQPFICDNTLFIIQTSVRKPFFKFLYLLRGRGRREWRALMLIEGRRGRSGKASKISCQISVLLLMFHCSAMFE